MNYYRPPARIPATPEYVLEVLLDQLRQFYAFEWEMYEPVELTFETTIAELCEPDDFRDSRQLGRRIDEVWNLGHSDSEWRAVLQPADKRTLRDLCDFIAKGSLRPDIRPLRLLGTDCRPAGAFLAIRSILSDYGANVESLRPSTPLEDYTSHYPEVFLGPIARLAPNTIPSVHRIRPPWRSWIIDRCIDGVLIASLIASIALLLQIGPDPEAVKYSVISGVLLFGSTILAGSIVSGRRTRRLPKLEFGTLQSFRDLSMTISEGKRL